MNSGKDKKETQAIGTLPTNIDEWLVAKSETVSREKALTARLISDLMLAAGARGYGLSVYEPLVDRDGFDLIVDDTDNAKSLQLKTRATSGAPSWDIRKDLLRPSLEMRAEALGFTETVEGIGRGGGVIVQDIRSTDQASATLSFRYLYTDVYVLLALEAGFAPYAQDELTLRQSAAAAVLTKLHRGIGRDKVRLPIATFVEAVGTPELLALMAIHTTSTAYGWQTNLVHLIDRGPPTQFNDGYRKMTAAEKNMRNRHLRTHLTDKLRSLIIV